MIIYVNSYVPGDGYSIKYYDSQEEGADEFRDGRGQMQDWERKIFTRTGARLFWGIHQGAAFGCIRQLETGMRDENGRQCFHNIGFHEEIQEGQTERPATCRIISYVVNHYEDFVWQVDEMIFCRDGDFYIDVAMLGKMREKWEKTDQKTENKARKIGSRKAWLIPESTKTYFLKNTEAPFREEDIRQMDLKETDFMNMFFYCSGPGTGYLLKQIDPVTGRVLQEGKQAGQAMSSHGFAVLTRGGADMALYKKDGILCFVAKNIESESTDHYGRRKYMSLCFEAKGKKEAAMCQLAAWALLDFPAFCRDMTGCMDVFDGLEGYSIRAEELKSVIRRFERKLYLPKEKSEKEWEMIVEPVREGEFRFMVLNASLEYFNRSVRMDVDRKQIGLRIDSGGLEKRKSSPLNLTFTEHLYEPGSDRKTKEAEESVKSERHNRESINEDFDKVDLLEKKWFRALLMLGGIVAIAGAVFLGIRFLSQPEDIAAAEFAQTDGRVQTCLWPVLDGVRKV